MSKTNCSRCNKPRAPSKKYCAEHHNAYMREWRKTHRLTGEARAKMNARSYANVYQRRGKLKPQPCEHCGTLVSQKHHEDYSKPLEVTWLCRECHLKHHRSASGTIS